MNSDHVDITGTPTICPTAAADLSPSTKPCPLLQVMLLQGLTDTAAKEWKKGTHHGGQHLHQLLKFLTVRHEVDNAVKGRMERSGIMAVGGAHDAALDGPLDGDPRWTACFLMTEVSWNFLHHCRTSSWTDGLIQRTWHTICQSLYGAYGEIFLPVLMFYRYQLRHKRGQ